MLKIVRRVAKRDIFNIEGLSRLDLEALYDALNRVRHKSDRQEKLKTLIARTGIE